MSDEDGDRPATPAMAEPTAARDLSASQIMFANILVKQLAANIVSGLQEVLRPLPFISTARRWVTPCPSSNSGPTATTGTASGPIFAGCGTSVP